MNALSISHRVLLPFCLTLVCLAAHGQQTPAGSAPPLNPNQVALLRWYPINQAAEILVPGRIHSGGIAFDGANMWITGLVENTVSKVRASDGAFLGAFKVGTYPNAVAFDGANIWVVNTQDDTVTKLQASDGKVLGTFPVGKNPLDVIFDGAHVWVSNALDNTVMKLQVSDGRVLGTFAVTASPGHMAFDGANVWVGGSGAVSKVRASDGTILGTFSVCQPTELAFDGANIWITGYSCGTVAKLRASDGTVLGTFSTGGDLPTAIAFDSQYMWVANSGSSSFNSNVVKMRLTDGAIVSKFAIAQGAFAAAFDGADVWITGGDPIFKM